MVVVVLVEPDGGVAVSEGGIGRGEGGGRGVVERGRESDSFMSPWECQCQYKQVYGPLVVWVQHNKQKSKKHS